MSHISEWRQREVIEAVADQVEEDLEIAAQIVEVDARRRLVKISHPEFGRKYRWFLAYNRLKHFVRRMGSVIEAFVGMEKYYEGNTEKAASYGYYVEIGSRKYPPNPWLRPALLTNLKRIREFLEQ